MENDSRIGREFEKAVKATEGDMNSRFLEHVISVSRTLVALTDNEKHDRAVLIMAIDESHNDKSQALMVGGSDMKKLIKMFTTVMEGNGDIKKAIMIAIAKSIME